MGLFLLLLIPLAFAVGAFALSKGKIDPRELGVQVGVTLLIVIVPYCIALWSKTADKEIWNGVVAGKQMSHVSCCHPYCCQTCQSCTTDSKGNTTCSSYCCQTCYEHSYDKSWDAWSSNDESVYHDGCNSPYTSEPGRYTVIQIGEPTAIEHSYTNYIKGNPDTLLRRTGAADVYGARVPKYPEVYDYYRIQRFLTDQVKLPDIVGLNQHLSEINARLGAKKKVNIVVIVTNVADQRYMEAVREMWIGAKINDIVVLVGVNGDAILWAGVISWTPSEQVKVDLRNRVLDLQKFDGHALLNAVEEEVSAKFEHRRISEFEYLNASITPSFTFKMWLGIIAFLLNLGMTIYFWINDPFDNGRSFSYNRFRY